ncbi:MAG TPA: hypothetical protein VJW95_06230 [Dissulfurispiraceae bacterium]|nr:hypothetical protein [Dissulfurispiraceae bacterium]
MEKEKTYEYKNYFLYFIIRPDESRGPHAWTCCSGVNVYGFLPITKGRHGLYANPSQRGLQQLHHMVTDFAASRGGKSRIIGGTDCAGIVTSKDFWYSDVLSIESASDSFPEELITFCVINLLRIIFNSCMLELPLPEKLPGPRELQVFIEGLCEKYRQ